jgi:F0F1-type ATP synthase assembly protein I
MDNQSQSANEQSSNKDVRNWLSYSGMAFELFAIIGIFTALGYFLDKRLNTNPILLIIFLLIGLAAGFYRILKQFS